MLHLVGSGIEVVLVGCLHLHRRRMPLNTDAAIEADVVHVHNRVSRHDDAVFIHIGDTDASKVRHRAVVSEFSTSPFAADEADTAVAESVVHATVEANMRSPVPCVP